jgi:hypothetical protein
MCRTPVITEGVSARNSPVMDQLAMGMGTAARNRRRKSWGFPPRGGGDGGADRRRHRLGVSQIVGPTTEAPAARPTLVPTAVTVVPACGCLAGEKPTSPAPAH